MTITNVVVLLLSSLSPNHRNLAKSMSCWFMCSKTLLLWRAHHHLWRRWCSAFAGLWSVVPMLYVPPPPASAWVLWRRYSGSCWNTYIWKFEPGILDLNFFNYCDQQWPHVPTASINGSSHRAPSVGWLAQGLLPLLRLCEELSLTLLCCMTSEPDSVYLPLTNKGTLTSHSVLPLPSLHAVTVRSLY